MLRPFRGRSIIERCAGHFGNLRRAEGQRRVCAVKVGTPPSAPRKVEQRPSGRRIAARRPASGRRNEALAAEKGETANVKTPEHRSSFSRKPMDWSDARSRRRIGPADIPLMADYEPQRKGAPRRAAAGQKLRRIEVGPSPRSISRTTDDVAPGSRCCSSNGGAAQVAGELEANPLIPQGDELVATMMLEIDEPGRREKLLGRLGGIEAHLHRIQNPGGARGASRAPTGDAERTTADEAGPPSVHFFHFHFSDATSPPRDPARSVVLDRPPHYGHMALLGGRPRRALGISPEASSWKKRMPLRWDDCPASPSRRGSSSPDLDGRAAGRCAARRCRNSRRPHSTRR